MARRKVAKKVRALTDELGLTTPKPVLKRRPAAKSRKKQKL